MNSQPCHPPDGIPPGLELLHFKCSVYTFLQATEKHSLQKAEKKQGGKRLTGGLLSSQRLALPALVYSKDLEEIGRSWDQVNDFSKSAPGDGQSLAVLAGAADGDHLHAIAGHLALGWGPHDGDLDVRHLHKLQISGGRHFIWKHRGNHSCQRESRAGGEVIGFQGRGKKKKVNFAWTMASPRIFTKLKSQGNITVNMPTHIPRQYSSRLQFQTSLSTLK